MWGVAPDALASKTRGNAEAQRVREAKGMAGAKPGKKNEKQPVLEGLMKQLAGSSSSGKKGTRLIFIGRRKENRAS